MATKAVLVELVGATEVVAADKLRAVRMTPRPTTDENTVLLAIVEGICALLRAKWGAGGYGTDRHEM